MDGWFVITIYILPEFSVLCLTIFSDPLDFGFAVFNGFFEFFGNE